MSQKHFEKSWLNILVCSRTVSDYAAAAAESLQSHLTLCDSIDGSPPGSLVPGILQARTLEWVAISFSSAWKWKVKVKSLSRVPLLAASWTAAYQVPLSMEVSRQEYWSGVPLPSLNLMLYITIIQKSVCCNGSQQGAILPHRGHLAISENILVFTTWGQGSGRPMTASGRRLEILLNRMHSRVPTQQRITQLNSARVKKPQHRVIHSNYWTAVPFPFSQDQSQMKN